MWGDIQGPRRVDVEEMMDDFSITGCPLERALNDLRWVNRLLGGYSATMAHLRPWLRRQRGRRVRLLDLGTGVADFPEFLVRWAERERVDLSVVGVDANPATVAHAKQQLDDRLSSSLRSRIEVVTDDALDLSVKPNSFDAATAALFLHHLQDDDAVSLMQRMAYMTRSGFIINDLHRHVLAYYSIRLLGALLPVSEMFRHDGPLSVLRGFTRPELEDLLTEAGIPDATIRWHWAFRWVVSTL